MTSTSSPPPHAKAVARRRAGPLVGALAGACVVLGFGLVDALVFAHSARPQEFDDVAPWLALALVGATLVGAAAARAPALVALLALVAAVGVFAPDQLGLRRPSAQAFPPALLCALVAWRLVLAALERRARTSAVALGLGAGLLGASANAWLVDSPALYPSALAAGLVLVAASALPRRSSTAVSLLVVLALAVVIAREGGRNLVPKRADLGPPSSVAPAGSPDVLLIVLDTVRADRTSLYGHDRRTTPRLDRLAEERFTRFDNARATSPWTLPSHASLFTGLAPGEHGVTHPRGPRAHSDGGFERPYRLADETPTLAERLRETGWRTAAIVANNMLGSWAGLDRGFEHYDDGSSARIGPHHAFGAWFSGARLAGHKPYRDARVITDLALAWLDERTREAPFFLFLNYMDAHTPYAPPPPFDQRFGDALPANELAPREPELWPLLYDRELAFLDAELGRLFDGLDARDLLQDTLVVVTSDHGEAFGEHDTWAHEWSLYEELVRIPLLVQPPGGRTRAVAPEPVTLCDVHDLVLRHAGLPVPSRAATFEGHVAEWYYPPSLTLPEGFPGRSHEELGRDLIAWLDDGVKWIVSARGEVEAYDLAADPGERRPLAIDERQRTAALARARTWWDLHPPPEQQSEAIDAATLERLRDLGYVGEE